MRENTLGDGGHQSCLRRGKGLGRIHTFTRHCAGKAVGFIQKLQHRRNYHGTDNAADNQRNLLFPRRCFYQITRFQILQVVIGNRSHTNHRRAAKQRQRQQEFAVCLVRHQAAGFADQQQHQRNNDDRDDAHSRNRARRRTNQTGHITTSRSHQKADNRSQQRTYDHQQPSQTAGNMRVADKVEERHAQHQHHRQHPGNHRLRRQILFRAFGHLRAAEIAERQAHTLDHRFHQSQQRPNSRNTDRTRADKTDFFLPQRHRKRNHLHIGRLRNMRRQIRHGDTPGNRNTQQNRDTAGQTDQIARAQQGQRKAHRHLEHRRAAFKPKARAVRHHAQTACAEAHHTRQCAARHQFLDTAAAFLLVRIMVADLQNFSRRHAFRIRQIALHHHRITQRHSENHAQNTAGHTQQRCLPKRKARPITGHQQTRQNKNNTGERTRSRSLSLHHIIFQNIAAFKKLQNRHRNHRSRNRRRKS